MIIPAVLTLNKRIAKERIDLAQHMSGWVHLDFLDHTLYLFESLVVNDYAGINFGDLFIEAHCMTETPFHLLKSKLPIERLLVHIELPNWIDVYTECANAGKECWAVIAPETTIDSLELPADLQGVVMMGVEPGQTGQPFIESTYSRVEQFKDRYPDIAVTVDGGVGPQNIRLLLAHGADNLVVGSALWHTTDPVATFQALERLADPLGSIHEHQAA